MRHVRQANKWDCGCAALSMFTNIDYAQMQRSFPFATSERIVPDEELEDPNLVSINRFGLHPQEAYQWLITFHCPTLTYLETKDWYLNFDLDALRTKRFEESALLSAGAMRQMAEDPTTVRAMLIVDSWQNDGAQHWVVWCGTTRQVYDSHFDKEDRVPLKDYVPYIGIFDRRSPRNEPERGGSADGGRHPG